MHTDIFHSVTVISIVRLQALAGFANSDNPSWDNLEVSQWSTIEVNVGIICASMPTLRLLLLKVFPALSGSTRAYGGYHSSRSWGDKSAAMSGAGRSRQHAEVSLGSAARPTRPGITYQRSYAVHYQDPEASSQVQLNDLEPSRGFEAKGFEAKSHSSECSA